MSIKNIIKSIIKELPVLDKIFVCRSLWFLYRNEYKYITQRDFICRNIGNLKIIKNGDKVKQICMAMQKVDISICENDCFLYSLDPFLFVKRDKQVLDNRSIDYDWVVNSYFLDFVDADNKIIIELKNYIKRLEKDVKNKGFQSNIEEIESLFERPANHFHEAIQRILFINQWLWQTGHKHNGFGHLDWLLYDLYKKDIESEYITEEEAEEYIKNLFYVLHDKCWFKSTIMLGDTGQIIILGGLDNHGNYHSNDLTYLLIKVSEELRLPDPKVLLRVSSKMPDDLLESAMRCVATGIGAPFFSNDDVVIPKLIDYGYDKTNAYNYCTSACWEPLIVGDSCDQNNMATVNFCKPFVDFCDSSDFNKCDSFEMIKQKYLSFLSTYVDNLLSRFDDKEFDEDPFLTLLEPKVYKSGKDIVRGGTRYANIGLTSVGMASVVNSLINLKHYVFEEKKFSLEELNKIRKLNYEDNDDVRVLLQDSKNIFGTDEPEVINLTNEILRYTTELFNAHKTKLGGSYKFGLSSPSYITDANYIGATFDGRKSGEPFGTHISGKNGLPPTELINFAAQLDYSENRINGNVVDFILSPTFLQQNMDKAIALVKAGIKQGFYQMQINVVSSQVLIEAQKHPEQFPNLVVRVWGYSAYFKDLPKEYQDNLIKRALDAEKVA